jgi:hypothetical protein
MCRNSSRMTSNSFVNPKKSGKGNCSNSAGWRLFNFRSCRMCRKGRKTSRNVRHTLISARRVFWPEICNKFVSDVHRQVPQKCSGDDRYVLGSPVLQLLSRSRVEEPTPLCWQRGSIGLEHYLKPS